MDNHSSRTSTDIALLVMRVMIGIVFVYHGAQKLFGIFGGYGISGTAGFMESLGVPMPTVSATLAGGAEFFGGLAFISGFAQRLLALPLAFTMVVAVATAHLKNGFDNSKSGFEYPLTLLVMVVGLGILGPGRLAIRHGKS